MKKLIIINDSDIKYININEILFSVAKGFYLFPLDKQSIQFCITNKYPFICMDDWMESDDIINVINEASFLERNWFISERDLFTIDNICWPEFDRHSMNLFWRESILCCRLAEIFILKGVNEIILFRDVEPKPSVYYSPSDIYPVLFQKLLHDKIKVKCIIKKNTIKDYIKNKLRKAKRSILELPNGKIGGIDAFDNIDIIFILHIGEYYRFVPFLQQLKQSYPDRVGCITLFNNNNFCETVRKELELPVLNGPTYNISNQKSNKANFLNAFQRIKDNNHGYSNINSIYELDFHFDFYFSDRWVMLNNAFIFWNTLFQKLSPKYILSSSLYDGETQVPVFAAKKRGIKTISVPHSGITLHDNLINADLILYNYTIQKLFWQDAGIDSSRLKPCKNVLTENQYQVYKMKDNPEISKKTILIVMESLWRSQRLLETGLRQYLNDQQILGNIPQYILDRFNVIIKLYPLPDEVIFVKSIVKIDPKAVMIDTGELTSLLEQADLVISIDSISSAIIHIINHAKALIFYMPKNNKTSESLRIKNIYDRLSEGAELAYTENEIWEKAMQYFDDPDKKLQMDERVWKAREAYTSFDAFPTIRNYII